MIAVQTVHVVLHMGEYQRSFGTLAGIRDGAKGCARDKVFTVGNSICHTPQNRVEGRRGHDGTHGRAANGASRALILSARRADDKKNAGPEGPAFA